jgi:hypothetical protein
MSFVRAHYAVWRRMLLPGRRPNGVPWIEVEQQLAGEGAS